jgi:hypothetical protein
MNDRTQQKRPAHIGDTQSSQSIFTPVTPMASQPTQTPVHTFSQISIQPKLTVSQPDDPYEREADRVADEVMRMSDPMLSIKGENVLTHVMPQTVKFGQISPVSTSIQRYSVPSDLACSEVPGWLDSNSPYAPEWAETACDYKFNGQAKLNYTTSSDGSIGVNVTGHPGLSVSKACPIDMPQWTPSQRSNRAAEITAWSSMTKTLKAHEQQHQKIGESQRKTMEKDFRTVNITASGSDRNEAKSNAVSQLAAEQAQWQQAAQAAQSAIDPFKGAILSCP